MRSHEPAFPVNASDSDSGMELRDYLAAHAPSWWMGRFTNPTVASAKIMMHNRGIITKEESNKHGFTPSTYHFDTLRCRGAYEYADAMLEARDT